MRSWPISRGQLWLGTKRGTALPYFSSARLSSNILTATSVEQIHVDAKKDDELLDNFQQPLQDTREFR